MVLDSSELGSRIAQARHRAGLTQEDLARSAGVDRSAITKIEGGSRRVAALELARIAASVGERIEWFTAEVPPAIVSHRNVTDPGEPSPPIDNALERIVRAVEFVSEHDGELRSILQDTPKLGESIDLQDVEATAQLGRELLGVGHDEPIHELSQKLVNAGVLAFVMELGTDSADAASVLLRAGAVAMVNGSLRTGRRRLSLAHEFGHVLLADEYTVDWRVDTSKEADRRENAIDRFARALLLPRAGLSAKWDLGGGGDALRTAAIRTASHFRVDMATLARRLLDLGLITATEAATVRLVRTKRADIVEHDLLVADELPPGELPREYEAAVLRLYGNETISDVRALDLLLDTWELNDLPALPMRHESEIWQFVS